MKYQQLNLNNCGSWANVLYLATFSNYWIDNFIRPGGIFDEPGTLSFLVCALAALRVIYHRRNSVSVALLVLGMVTFSLTHAFFFFPFLFFMDRRDLKFKLRLCFAILILMALATSPSSKRLWITCSFTGSNSTRTRKRFSGTIEAGRSSWLFRKFP